MTSDRELERYRALLKKLDSVVLRPGMFFTRNAPAAGAYFIGGIFYAYDVNQDRLLEFIKEKLSLGQTPFGFPYILERYWEEYSIPDAEASSMMLSLVHAFTKGEISRLSGDLPP